MQAIEQREVGYWVEWGWSPEARPQVISIIDMVGKDSVAGGRAPVGGIAWAGDRGIKLVEVQVDEGPWTQADFITPPLGPLTWVLWRYDWPVTPGRHKFSVRATDGKGALQNGQLHDTYPDSATDYHAVTETFFDRLPHHCPVDYQDTRRIICRTGGLLLDHLSAFG